MKLLLKASNHEPTFTGHYKADFTEDTDVGKYYFRDNDQGPLKYIERIGTSRIIKVMTQILKSLVLKI